MGSVFVPLHFNFLWLFNSKGMLIKTKDLYCLIPCSSGEG